MLGTVTKKCKVKKEAPMVFRITLVQGLNRQIRRMCQHFGFEVTKLERVRIMNVSLKGLPPGEWRDFTDDELIELFRLLENSTSLDPAEKKINLKPQRRKARQQTDRQINQLRRRRHVSALTSQAERKRDADRPVLPARRGASYSPPRSYHRYLQIYTVSVRSFFAASTIFARACRVSLQPRVFRPQSGLTHSRLAGICRAALRSRCSISATAGTFGE